MWCNVFFQKFVVTELHARTWAEPNSYENLSILENLVITWLYTARPSAPQPMFNSLFLPIDNSLGAQMQPDIAYSCCDQLTAVKTGYPLTVSRAQVSTHRGRVFCNIFPQEPYYGSWFPGLSYNKEHNTPNSFLIVLESTTLMLKFNSRV